MSEHFHTEHGATWLCLDEQCATRKYELVLAERDAALARAEKAESIIASHEAATKAAIRGRELVQAREARLREALESIIRESGYECKRIARAALAEETKP